MHNKSYVEKEMDMFIAAYSAAKGSNNSDESAESVADRAVAIFNKRFPKKDYEESEKLVLDIYVQPSSDLGEVPSQKRYCMIPIILQDILGVYRCN